MQLITDEYKNQISQMEDWGGNGWKWANTTIKLIFKYKIKTALDYGCGQGSLKKKVLERLGQRKFKYNEYDPADSKKGKLPIPAELVTCTDVLEHIEPEYINEVIMNLLSLTQKVGFIVICTRSTVRTLPDGRCAHLIIQEADWWVKKISQLMLFRNEGFNSIERLFSSRLDNNKQLILVIRKVSEKELLDKE
jgi:hypothetical protein